MLSCKFIGGRWFWRRFDNLEWPRRHETAAILTCGEWNQSVSASSGNRCCRITDALERGFVPSPEALSPETGSHGRRPPGSVRTPYRIDSVPTAPSPRVPSAGAQWMRPSTTDDSAMAIHIALRAPRFADAGMPPFCAKRRRGGPSHLFSRSQRSKRGELREKQYDAPRTKTVVGSPGTTTPAIARATAHQPRLP